MESFNLGLMELFNLQNICSLWKNVDELQVLVHSLKEKFNWDLAVKNEPEKKVFNIAGCNFTKKKLQKKRGGGLVYIRQGNE